MEQSDYYSDEFSKESNITSLEYLKAFSLLAKNDKYFILGEPENGRWDAAPKNLVKLQDFNDGVIDNPLGLWLNAGSEKPEPLARIDSSTIASYPLTVGQAYSSKNNGSIMSYKFYCKLAETGVKKYFEAKAKIKDEELLSLLPSAESQISIQELVWLQYWDNAMNRRIRGNYQKISRSIDYSRFINLVYSNLSLERKLVFYELGILAPKEIKEYRDIPFEWLYEMRGTKDSLFLKRVADWAMPEMPPKQRLFKDLQK